MELVHPLVEKYAQLFSSPEDTLLRKVSEETIENHAHAHMLSGHLQGSFLTTLSKLLHPQRILEIGTFTGYSALCLAKGLSREGILHTIELREEDAAVANKYFQQSPDKEKIVQHIGNAMEIIPVLQESWDIVFIDADKTGYIDYYEMVFPYLKHNGLIIADNVLFHGQVLEENITGKNAVAIHAFNQHIKKDARVDQTLLTVRDGLLLIRKL
jgi:predicted O-methyltransferase YrrM